MQPAGWPDIPIIVTPKWGKISLLPGFLHRFPFLTGRTWNYISVNVLMDPPHLQCFVVLWDSQLLVF